MTGSKPHGIRTLTTGCTLLCLTLACGCRGEDVPKTYPVRGKVLLQNKPLDGGTVQFKPLADTPCTTVGDIEAGGTFTLRTLCAGKMQVGAPPGEYRVTVLLSTDGGQTVKPREAPKTCKVEPHDNDFVIELDGAKP